MTDRSLRNPAADEGEEEEEEEDEEEVIEEEEEEEEEGEDDDDDDDEDEDDGDDDEEDDGGDNEDDDDDDDDSATDAEAAGCASVASSNRSAIEVWREEASTALISSSSRCAETEAPLGGMSRKYLNLKFFLSAPLLKSIPPCKAAPVAREGFLVGEGRALVRAEGGAALPMMLP